MSIITIILCFLSYLSTFRGFTLPGVLKPDKLFGKTPVERVRGRSCDRLRNLQLI